MNSFLKIASALQEQANATVSRSDILKPLAWLVGLLVTALVALVVGNAVSWLLIIVVALLVVSVFFYCYGFIVCLSKNPDALRSEKYTLHKMAIEHGFFGDSISGTIDSETDSNLASKKIDSSKPTNHIEHKE